VARREREQIAGLLAPVETDAEAEAEAEAA